VYIEGAVTVAIVVAMAVAMVLIVAVAVVVAVVMLVSKPLTYTYGEARAKFIKETVASDLNRNWVYSIKHGERRGEGVISSQ